mmetsp:Transcript_11191/g.17304  ORF Transcript_11191/g.17304 Transcript_11191/m.17304 type:complete len:150 (-) Transcript_11191:252-701(-)
MRCNLTSGQLEFLTVLPAGPVALQHAGSGCAKSSAGESGSSSTQTRDSGEDSLKRGPSRQLISLHNQHKNMKAAWSATGHTSLFGPGSPFHDPNKKNNKKVMLSDNPGTRMCLPMALNGACHDNCKGKHGALTKAKETRVAEAGNLTVS